MVLAAVAMAVTACGTAAPSAPTAAGGRSGPTTTATGPVQLSTLTIGAEVTRQAVQAALPDARILVFDKTPGRAVVSMPAHTGRLQAAGLTAERLRGLDAGVMAVEDDTTLSVQGSDPEAAGLTTWAGGLTTWAGGVITWAGGQTFLTSSTYTDMNAYWAKLNLSLAQQRIPEGGGGIVVAVLDTGIDMNHPLLAGHIDVLNDWDYVDADDTPDEVAAPAGAAINKYGHGTAVAGIILQIAPNAMIQSNRVLRPDGTGDLSSVVLAVTEAVDWGANIINMSLGTDVNSTALNTAIASVLARGVPVVNSAGNTGTEGLLYPGRNVGTAQFPVNSGLIAVGSVSMGLKKSGFTSFGTNMSLTSPGESVLSAYPGSRLAKVSGTSFSAPAVSGALALAMSAGVRDVKVLTTNIRAQITPNLDSTYNAKLGTGTLNVGKFADFFR